MRRDLRAYLEDQRHSPHNRKGAACPFPWLVVQLAERFHVLPWHLESEPYDRVQYYTALLSIEGAYHTDTAGMEPDEDYYDEDET